MLSRHEPIESFFADAGGPADQFPAVAWLEPCYGGARQNDGHPPASIHNAESLVASVYNALRGNEALWQSTLFIVVTDECGGFFDPVVPPATTPPGPEAVYQQTIYTQLGFRVPCLLISPWLPAQVDSTTYDHTSWLRYVQRKFGLGPLGERTARATDFAGLILPAPRTDCPPPFVVAPAAPMVAAGPLSDFQGELTKMLVELAVAAGQESPGCKTWADGEALVRHLMPKPASAGIDAPGPARPAPTAGVQSCGCACA